MTISIAEKNHLILKLVAPHRVLDSLSSYGIWRSDLHPI